MQGLAHVVHLSLHTHTHARMCVRVCVCLRMCVCVCVCVCSALFSTYLSKHMDMSLSSYPEASASSIFWHAKIDSATHELHSHSLLQLNDVTWSTCSHKKLSTSLTFQFYQHHVNTTL